MASELEREIVSKIGRLPPDHQREVLDFAEFLGCKDGARPDWSSEQKQNALEWPEVLSELAGKYPDFPIREDFPELPPDAPRLAL